MNTPLFPDSIDHEGDPVRSNESDSQLKPTLRIPVELALIIKLVVKALGEDDEEVERVAACFIPKE